MKNIKKFKSLDEFNAYRASDGWNYPAINYVNDDEGNKQVFYNNEFIMRWYDDDMLKTPTLLGDIKYEEFKYWVDNCSLPCEIKRDGTDFSYLLTDISTDNSKLVVSDYTKRSDGTPSHYNTDDKDEYLQVTEISNINVGIFSGVDVGGSYKEVRFNFDKGCPLGFRKWFGNSYFNEERNCYTKLWGRYDATINADSALDVSAGNRIEYNKKWVPSKFKESREKTNRNILGVTYWEQYVLGLIFTAYYKTFNHSSIFTKTCKILNTKTGESDLDCFAACDFNLSKDEVENHKFMFLENPLFFNKKGGIFTFGYLVSKENEKDIISITFDELIANDRYLDSEIADIKIDASKLEWGKDPGIKFIHKIDSYGNSIISDSNVSSTTGICASVINNHGPNFLRSSKGVITGGIGYSADQVSAFTREVSNNGTNDDSSVELRFRVTMIRE